MPASFQSLPTELLLFICKFLDLEQLVYLSQVHFIFCRIDRPDSGTRSTKGCDVLQTRRHPFGVILFFFTFHLYLYPLIDPYGPLRSKSYIVRFTKPLLANEIYRALSSNSSRTFIYLGFPKINQIPENYTKEMTLSVISCTQTEIGSFSCLPTRFCISCPCIPREKFWNKA
jgi:hypothetical protein